MMGMTTKIPISTAVIRQFLAIFHASSAPLITRELANRVEMDISTAKLVLTDMRKHGIISRVHAGKDWMYFINGKKNRKKMKY